MNNLSLIISAPSGSGKTTIINKLLEDPFYSFVISTTTRPPREGEIDGENYYFISSEQFQKMIKEDEFLEWAKVHNNYYGTTEKEIDRIKKLGHISVFDIDVQGFKQVQTKLTEYVSVFIIPPSLEILALRLRERNSDSEETIKLRLENAISELKEFKIYDYLVINDDLEEAVNNLKSIVNSVFSQQRIKKFNINDFLGGEKC